MNRSDLPRLVKQLERASTTVNRYGMALWDATYDWQSPLRSGGGPSSKGTHSDPTATAMLKPDPLALEHAALQAELDALYTAAVAIEATLMRLRPIDPNKIERGRQNAVPPCNACDGPAPQPRSGYCEPCYRVWLRAGRPDRVRFGKDRKAALAPPDKEYA